MPADPLTLEQARAQWAPVPGYLNAATLGLPPRGVVAALEADIERWSSGRSSAPGYDAAVARCRELYAGLVGVPESWVAVHAQTSVMVSLLAAALPDGAEVVLPEGDFTSVVFPFLVHADRGVRVRQVPLAGLADAVRASTTLVAFSLAQSSDGTRDGRRGRARGGGSARGPDLLRHHPGGGLDAVPGRRLRPHHLLGVQVALPSARDRLPHGPARGHGPAAADPRRVVRRGVALGLGLRPADAARRRRPPVRRVAGLVAMDGARCRRWSCSPDSTPSSSGPTTSPWPTACWPGWTCRRGVRRCLPAGRRRSGWLAAFTARGVVVAGRAGRVRIAFHLWNDAVRRRVGGVRSLPGRCP